MNRIAQRQFPARQRSMATCSNVDYPPHRRKNNCILLLEYIAKCWFAARSGRRNYCGSTPEIRRGSESPPAGVIQQHRSECAHGSGTILHLRRILFHNATNVEETSAFSSRRSEPYCQYTYWGGIRPPLRSRCPLAAHKPDLDV